MSEVFKQIVSLLRAVGLFASGAFIAGIIAALAVAGFRLGWAAIWAILP